MVERLSYNEFTWQKHQRIPFGVRTCRAHRAAALPLPSLSASIALNQAMYFGALPVQKNMKWTSMVRSWAVLNSTIPSPGTSGSGPPASLKKALSFIIRRSNCISRTSCQDQEQGFGRPDLFSQGVELTGKKGKETIDLGEISSLSITFQDVVEYYVGRVKYRFTFDPRRHMSVKLFYDLLASLIKS